jgi:energy-coupling factor transport system ATP-binding protein
MGNGRILADMPPARLLCGGLLKESGIREPLYVTACKYAGVRLTPEHLQAGPEHLVQVAPDAPNASMQRGDTGLDALNPSALQGNVTPYALRLRLNDAEREMVRNWFTAVALPEDTSDAPVLLSVENLGFTYGAGLNPSLTGVNFVIREGEMTAIAGTNGAGKSTLAKLICGFEVPDAGRILWRGRDMISDSIAERAVNIG